EVALSRRPFGAGGHAWRQAALRAVGAGPFRRNGRCRACGHRQGRHPPRRGRGRMSGIAVTHVASRFWQSAFSVAVVLIVALTAFVLISPLGTMLARVFFPAGQLDLSGFAANFAAPATL